MGRRKARGGCASQFLREWDGVGVGKKINRMVEMNGEDGEKETCGVQVKVGGRETVSGCN